MKMNNFAHHWCTLMIDSLMQMGVDHFFIAPGSRSTPLVSAIVRHKDARIFSGIDERSLGFMAQGYSKVALKPGVVVVTSGTAVANLYPAVAEAFLSEVPMLLLTADRPFELRDCGANQTMFQASLFQNHVIKSFDIAPPQPQVSRTLSRATFYDAYRACMGSKKGPVHLNIQLREPLSNVLHEGELWDQNQEIYADSKKEQAPVLDVVLHEVPEIFENQRGFLAVGELSSVVDADLIIAVAEKLAWPIYADITSNLRLRKHKNILHHADLALINGRFQNDLCPEVIVKLGGRIVSKRFWAWVEKQNGARRVAISQSPQRVDHTGIFSLWQVPSITSFLQRMKEKISWKNNAEWLNLDSYNFVEHKVNSFLETNRDNEAFYAAKLIAAIDQESVLFLSSSMPIRDVDQFAVPTAVPIHVYANRGASGIDGVISSAVGAAQAHKLPTVLLIGDVAFLHDTNGLMLVRASATPILIVVLNNGGGGIFHFLPIAKEPDIVTPFLDTPHDVSIKELCRAHHIHQVIVDNSEDFSHAIRDFYGTKKTTVIEVIIDKNHNVNVHKNLYESLVEI